MIKDNPLYVNPYLEVEENFAKEKLMLGDFSDNIFFEKVKKAEIEAKVAKENRDAQIRSQPTQSSTPSIHVRSHRTSGWPIVAPLVDYPKSEHMGEAQLLEASGEHDLVEQEVDQDFPDERNDALNIIVPPSKVVKWVYDEAEDDDFRIKACAEFMSDDSFIKSKEFREFIIHVKSGDIKRRIEEAREKVDPSL